MVLINVNLEKIPIQYISRLLWEATTDCKRKWKNISQQSFLHKIYSNSNYKQNQKLHDFLKLNFIKFEIEPYSTQMS